MPFICSYWYLDFQIRYPFTVQCLTGVFISTLTTSRCRRVYFLTPTLSLSLD